MQQSLQQLITDRLKIPLASVEGATVRFVVDDQYPITLDFSHNQLVMLAPIVEVGLEDQSACFRRVATACLNLAQICREQVYLNTEKCLMLRRIISQSELTLPEFEQLLQDFLNTLTYLVGITQKF